MIVYDQYIYHTKPDLDDDIVVFHSGFCSAEPHYTHGKDTRDYFLIHYVIKGKGSYNSGSKTYQLSQNDGFLILPHQTIVHTADNSDPWNLIFIAFYGKKATALLADAGLDKDHLLFHYDTDDYLEQCIKNIYNESRNTKNIPRIKGYFYLFLATLIDSHNLKTNKNNTNPSFSHFDAGLNYIRRNIHSQITVDSLANVLRLNPSQVYRIFKKNSGLSPQQLINKMRIEKSCELLTKTDLTITEISSWMDFEYPSHFTRYFKTIMRITPSEYRTAHLER